VDFFCLIPTLTSEIYGLAHFGANYGLLLTASAAGSIFLSEAVAGPVADLYKITNSVCLATTTNGTCTTQCYGAECFEYTYFALTGVCVLCFLAALWLHKRQKKDIEIKKKDAEQSLAQLPRISISTGN